VTDAFFSARRHIHLVHTLEELDNLPEPKVPCKISSPWSYHRTNRAYASWTEQVVLTTSPSLECGFSKELFVRWAPEPRNSIIFTTTSPPASLASRILKLVKNPTGDRTISFSVTQKVFLEGAELALHEVKERKRLRVEAENKAKEMEEAAMEDMMMGIEDYESEEEEEEAAQEGKPSSVW
jgi:cleavage and polyadenylation specificity factor subunit 2